MSSELQSNFEPTAFVELQRTLRKSLGRRTHAIGLTEADSSSRSGFIEQIPAKGERERVDVRMRNRKPWLLLTSSPAPAQYLRGRSGPLLPLGGWAYVAGYISVLSLPRDGGGVAAGIDRKCATLKSCRKELRPPRNEL